MNTKNHKLAAIVFTDIVGYTKRMEENENNTMLLLHQQREILFPIVKAHGGEVVKEIGDGLLIMFHSAIEAVRFAIETQDRLKDEELTIRAGIHIGDVIFEEGDVFGSAVNTAARIEPLAPPNGICISEDVRNQIRNKDDFHTISIGKKELKGVNETIEIYKVTTEDISPEESKQKLPFFNDLWKRKIIHIVGAYLLSSLIIIYIVSAIVSSLLLSPHLVDFAWIALLSLLPAVFILSYFHAQKSNGKWAMTEKIGLPVNLIFSALLLIFLFNGKDLGATTKALTIENEDGEKVERVVVKNEFRKKIAIFFFENETNDSTFNWLQYGITNMIDYDLSQDIFINTKSSFNFFNKLKEFGFPKGVGLPFTLEKKIADYYHLNYFLTGSFTKQNNDYSLKVNLYETKTGKLLTENNFTGTDIFNLIDELTLQLKKDLAVPESHLEEVNDLPLSDIFTNSFTALKNFTKGNNLIVIDNNWPKGTEYIEKAIKEDAGFMVAYLTLAEYYFNTNQVKKAEESLQIVIQNRYKLPERLQFITKYFNYVITLEPEKAFAILKMWVELFPDDTQGHTTLAAVYINKNQIKEAISQLELILKIDPEQYDYLTTIGNLYVKMAEYDKALDYFKQYEKQFPKDYQSYKNIGYLYFIKGDYEQAKSYYEKALLMETGKISLLLNLAKLEKLLGNFNEALDQNLKALKKCKTSSDSMQVYGSLESYYESMGQMNESVKYMELKFKEMGKYSSPKDILVSKVFDIDKYTKANKDDKAFKMLKEIEEQFDAPVDKVVYFGYLRVYLELEDVDNARKAIIEAEKIIEGFGEEVLRVLIIYGQARIYEMEEEYDKAINSYLKVLELQPTGIHINKFIGRCYRKLNEFKKAEKYLLIALKDSPYNPKNNYELSLLYLDLENTQKALDHLKVANDIWKNADKNYKPAQEAKAKLEEVKQSNVS
jgi:class 3 adenylate cyclase/tetratricopeptide (TPR) repeat protein/TolB-like protein